jgi:hypothetical protein
MRSIGSKLTGSTTFVDITFSNNEGYERFSGEGYVYLEPLLRSFRAHYSRGLLTIQNKHSFALRENNGPGLVPVHTPPALFHRRISES